MDYLLKDHFGFLFIVVHFIYKQECDINAKRSKEICANKQFKT